MCLFSLLLQGFEMDGKQVQLASARGLQGFELIFIRIYSIWAGV